MVKKPQTFVPDRFFHASRRPGLRPGFTRPGHRVKGPEEFAGPRVPSAYIAVRALAGRAFAVAQPVMTMSPNTAGGDCSVYAPSFKIAQHAFLQIDAPFVAEARARAYRL